MQEDHAFNAIANHKYSLIREFIQNYLGHTPTDEERRGFSIMHWLQESKIYYKGKLVGIVRSDLLKRYSLETLG